MCSRVRTTVCLYKRDINETIEEKAWWDLLIDAVSGFQEIVEPVSDQTAVVRQLTSHLRI